MQAPKTAKRTDFFSLCIKSSAFQIKTVLLWSRMKVFFIGISICESTCIWFHSSTASDEEAVPSHAVLTFCHHHNQKQENCWLIFFFSTHKNNIHVKKSKSWSKFKRLLFKPFRITTQDPSTLLPPAPLKLPSVFSVWQSFQMTTWRAWMCLRRWPRRGGASELNTLTCLKKKSNQPAKLQLPGGGPQTTAKLVWWSAINYNGWRVVHSRHKGDEKWMQHIIGQAIANRTLQVHSDLLALSEWFLNNHQNGIFS